MMLENKDGVHAFGPSVCNGGEFTLCGDSFDIAETEPGFSCGPLLPTTKKIVTCARCIAMIKHCRGIRFKTTK